MSDSALAYDVTFHRREFRKMTNGRERNAWALNFHSIVICPGVHIDVTEVAGAGSAPTFQVGDEINCSFASPNIAAARGVITQTGDGSAEILVINTPWVISRQAPGEHALERMNPHAETWFVRGQMTGDKA